ncbi:MAG: ROK family protein [Pseudomonadota bacterium]
MRIGIDLGGTKTEGIVMDAQGDIICCKRVPTPVQHGYKAILETISLLVEDLEQDVGGHCVVGVGTPGARSSRTGVMKNCNTICLNGKPLFEDLQRFLSRPVRIANDANCFALSEARDGAGRHVAMVFGVIMGTGVGGGIVHHGQLHEGKQYIAGEWGHNILELDGPPCYCGHQGCVETLISGPGLVRDYRAHLDAEQTITAEKIVALAAQGDAQAEDAMQRFFDRFGRALAMVINILDPDAVVLGGGLSNIDRLYTEGRAAVAKYVFNDEFRTPILKNVHGDSSGVRGAAQLWRADEV